MPSPLAALSPLDGRYARTADPLREYFSEQALIRYRLRIELAWLEALAAERAIRELKPFSRATKAAFGRLVKDFSERDAEHIKNIEAETNHDVKAIEYWLKSKLATNREVHRSIEFVHFACTSEDVSNLAYALMVAESRDRVMLPGLDRVVAALRELARRHAALPMLSRTHGQAATPTTLGKEVANFAHRLRRARERIAGVAILGKANGAVGNYNAHLTAYPAFDWERFCRRFVERLGLEFNAYTTQIEPHDWLAELLDAYARANSVLLDLDRDVWGYISLGYFTQKLKKGEVGSSTMPHKVNPIDFENSEGNVGVANALLRHLADKLEADPRRLAADLESNWEVLAEAVQQVMRRHGVPDAYERLKAISRGKRLDRGQLAAFVRKLPIPAAAKKRLLALTPATYTGLAADLARRV